MSNLPEGWTNDFIENCSLYSLILAIQRHVMSSGKIARDDNQVDSSLHQISFRSSKSLAFPATEVSRVTLNDSDIGQTAWHVEVTRFGLLGSVGTLPPRFSCLVQDVGDADRSIFRDFLAVFEDRAIKLHYLAMEKQDWLFRIERGFRNHQFEHDPYTTVLDALLGIANGEPNTNRLTFSSNLPRFFGGAFSSSRRPAICLAAILRHSLGVEADVAEHHGRWRQLGRHLRTRLGQDPESTFIDIDKQNSRLGVSTCAGMRVWTCQDSFLVTLGPLTREEFASLLPDGSLFDVANDMIRLYVGGNLEFSLQLVLKPDHVPELRLPSPPQNDEAPIQDEHVPKLGWNTWLLSKELLEPATDCVLASPDRLSTLSRK